MNADARDQGLLHLVTLNVDYAKPDPDGRVRQLLDLVSDADVMLLQEAKRVRLVDLLPPGWRTMQRVRDASVRGSAVCWFRHVVPTPSLHRLRLGALPTNGRKLAAMLPRWIALVDVDQDGHPVTYVSCHWPPRRYDYLWPQMDRRVARLIARKVRQRRAVILGADMNTHPAIVAARLNRLLPQVAKVTAYGDHRIDGFLLAGPVHAEGPNPVHIDRAPEHYGLTDHPAVWLRVRFGR